MLFKSSTGCSMFSEISLFSFQEQLCYFWTFASSCFIGTWHRNRCGSATSIPSTVSKTQFSTVISIIWLVYLAVPLLPPVHSALWAWHLNTSASASEGQKILVWASYCTNHCVVTICTWYILFGTSFVGPKCWIVVVLLDALIDEETNLGYVSSVRKRKPREEEIVDLCQKTYRNNGSCPNTHVFAVNT